MLLVQRAHEAGLDRDVEVVDLGGHRRGRQRRADPGEGTGGADHGGAARQRLDQGGAIVDRRGHHVARDQAELIGGGDQAQPIAADQADRGAALDQGGRDPAADRPSCAVDGDHSGNPKVRRALWPRRQ
jgi:hypothetical protein